MFMNCFVFKKTRFFKIRDQVADIQASFGRYF